MKDIYFDALLAMEPSAYQGYGAVHNEKAKVFQAMRPLQPDAVMRGQYAGYRKEPGVGKGSDVKTFCALRLYIDSWPQEIGSRSTNFAAPRFSKSVTLLRVTVNC